MTVAAGSGSQSGCRRSFFHALSAAAFDGPIVFESFSSAIVSGDLSGTLGVWRNLWDDSDDLAAHANAYIRGAIRAIATIRGHQRQAPPASQEIC